MKQQRQEIFNEQLAQKNNCAQVVLAAFCEEFGLATDAAMKITGGMGGGMCLGEKCGAVTAMFLVAGLWYGRFDGADLTRKNELKDIVKKLNETFTEEFTCTDCKTLMKLLAEGGIDYPPEYAGRPCAVLMHRASEILEEQLKI